MTTMNIVNSCETSLSPQVILELEPGAAEQPDSRGKNYLHTAIIKVDNFLWQNLIIGVLPLQSDLESLLFLISINVNVHSKTTDSNKLAPLLLAVQVLSHLMHSLSHQNQQGGQWDDGEESVVGGGQYAGKDPDRTDRCHTCVSQNVWAYYDLSLGLCPRGLYSSLLREKPP